MVKKLGTFFILLLSIICFMGFSPNKVSAHSWYWFAKKPRTVVLMYPKKIYELQGQIPAYKDKVIRTRTLPEGTVIKIQHGWHYDWMVSGHGLSTSPNNWSGRFWITAPEKNNNWFDTYKKTLWVDTSFFHKGMKTTGKSKKITWKTWVRLIRKGNLDY